MIGLSAAYVVNGYLLKSFKLSSVYAFGLVGQSIPCLILFFVSQIGSFEVLSLGFITGLAGGFYWANRNILVLDVTKSTGRDFFCGLEGAQSTLLSVVSPVLFGWFLELGAESGHLGVIGRYQLLAVVTVTIQVIGAWYILRARFSDYFPNRIIIKRSSALWTRARVFTAVKGVAEGSAVFIPTLIALRLIGQEGALGLTQSIATIFASIFIYLIAARMRDASRQKVLDLGVYLMVLGGVAISYEFSSIGALIYIALQTLAVQLLWLSANPIIFDAIDRDHKEEAMRYSYIVDRELFLNFGRFIGVVVILWLTLSAGSEVALRVSPLILALVTSGLLVVSRGLTGLLRDNS